MSNLNLEYIPHKTAQLFSMLVILKFISNHTLVGGTALSLQIEHRQSEDLDFIFDNETLNNQAVKRNIAKFFSSNKIIRNEKDYQIDFLVDGVKLPFFSSGAVFSTVQC